MPSSSRQQGQWRHVACIVTASISVGLLTVYLALSLAANNTSVVPVESGQDECVPPDFVRTSTAMGFDMAVLKERDIVSDDIFSTGYWDINSSDAFAEGSNVSMPTSGTFLDIGGNIGVFSLLFAHANYTVLTVEPMTRNRRAIQASLCLNPRLRDRIKVLPVALVAPEDKSLTCIIKPTNLYVNMGNGFLTCGSWWWVSLSCGYACERVPVKTLDELLAEVQPSAIDVVKLDIENYECKVLQGGHSLFERLSAGITKRHSRATSVGCFALGAPLSDLTRKLHEVALQRWVARPRRARDSQETR